MNHRKHPTACRRRAAIAVAALAAGFAATAFAQTDPIETAQPLPEAWQALTAALAPSIDVTYHQVEALDGQVTATSVRFATADTEASRGALTVGRLELAGVPDSLENTVIADRIVMHDVLYRPGGSGVGRVDRLTIENPRGLAAFLQTLAALPDPDGDDGTDTAAAEDAEPAEPENTIAALLSALQALELESLVVEGVTTVERRGRSRQQTLSLDRLTLGAVDEGLIESLVLDGLAITDRSRVGIDRIDLRAMDVGHWLTMAAETDVELIPLALLVEPGIDAVSVVGFEMTRQDGSSLLGLAGASFETLDGGEATAGASLVVDRLAFPVRALDDADAEATLRDLGYTDIEASFGAVLQLDRAAETLDVGPIRLDVVDMAMIEFAFALGRFDLETLIGQVQTMARTGIPQLPPTTLNSARVELTDASLTGRLVQRTASAMGLTTDQVVAEAVGAASSVADEWQLAEPHRGALLGTIEGFLADPGTLTIEAEPDRPVTLLEAGLGAVAGPGTLFDRLNVVITTQ